MGAGACSLEIQEPGSAKPTVIGPFIPTTGSTASVNDDELNDRLKMSGSKSGRSVQDYDIRTAAPPTDGKKIMVDQVNYTAYA